MTRIKICGLFRREDIAFVNAAQPDYIGFVFASSRRQISMAYAKQLRPLLHPSITPVGVFVNAPVEMIASLYEAGVIAMAQLHGWEDERYFSRLRQISDVPIIKALRVEKTADIHKWEDTSADYLLFDGSAGGRGKAFDWKLIDACRKPFFLAGGIHSGNLAQAMDALPYCVDISSGAETERQKDGDKIRCLVEACHKEAG